MSLAIDPALIVRPIQLHSKPAKHSAMRAVRLLLERPLTPGTGQVDTLLSIC